MRMCHHALVFAPPRRRSTPASEPQLLTAGNSLAEESSGASATAAPNDTVAEATATAVAAGEAGVQLADASPSAATAVSATTPRSAACLAAERDGSPEGASGSAAAEAPSAAAERDDQQHVEPRAASSSVITAVSSAESGAESGGNGNQADVPEDDPDSLSDRQSGSQSDREEYTAEDAHWAWLLPLIRRAGCPVLHPNFAAAAEVTQPPAVASEAASLAQDVVLHKLRLCAESGLLQVGSSFPSPQGRYA